MINLAGLHDRESTSLGVRNTWALHTVALSENPTPPDFDPAYAWVTRLNWGYGSTGTLPPSDYYGEFAQRVANYVKGTRGCSRWVIGNEPNLSREWPDNQPIRPWEYAHCFIQCRDAIHNLPGHVLDEVLIAAPGPWNNELKYTGNPNGDWIQYFEDVIKTLGTAFDGFSIHSYTHGYNVALVTSSARMQAPFQSRHYEFRTYRDYIEAIPDSLAHLPIYLTEANGNGPWQAVGLMPAMLGEIDAWNKQSKHKIQCVIFYRWPKYDDNAEFAIDGKQDVINEYKAAVSKGYLSPTRETNEVNTHIPTISPGNTPTEPSLPPRNIDPRAVARGVTIETPRVSPGQQFWRVVKVQWYDEQESQGRHHIYVEAPADEAFRVMWPGEGVMVFTNGKSGFDAGNFPMSPSRNEFSVRMAVRMPENIPSETVKGIGMGMDTPSGFNAGIHTSTGVVFQLVTMPATTTPPSEGPVPVEKPPVTMWVNAPAGLNLRTAPVTGNVLTAIPFGAEVEVIGDGLHEGFAYVRAQGKVGWANATYLSEKRPSAQEPTPTPPTAPTNEGEAWRRTIAYIRRWEGGYVDNPNDKGGATNKGVTLATYTRWCKVEGLPVPTKDDLRNISDATVDRIYYIWYWKGSGADKLPWPLCLAQMDTAVNAGVGQAQEMLAKSNGNFMAYVGHVGIWYTTLDDFQHFGRAWARRRFELLLEASK